MSCGLVEGYRDEVWTSVEGYMDEVWTSGGLHG